MTTVVITATAFCPGGGHVRMQLSGATDHVTMMETTTFSDPVTEDDAQAFIKIIGKMARMGRTGAQAKALLEAGVTVIV